MKPNGIVHFLRRIEGKPEWKAPGPDHKEPWPGKCTPSTLYELCEDIVKNFEPGDNNYYKTDLVDTALLWNSHSLERMWMDLSCEEYIHPELWDCCENWYQRMKAGDWPEERNEWTGVDRPW